MHKIWIGLFALMALTAFVSPKRISAKPAPKAAARMVSAVSLNLAKEANSRTVARAMHDAPRLREADVYLFQEVRNEAGKPSVAEEAARELGYSAAFEAAPGFTDQGLAIVSRYPMSNVAVRNLKPCDLRFRSRNRFAISATVMTPWGGVRVWNVHLDTRINAEERLDQLKPVMDDASRHSGPRLIGGDFNTNEMYWVGNVLPLPVGPAHASAIRESMKRHGFETPFAGGLNTFPMLRSHLDWIYLKDLQSHDASVEPAPFSDHHAIWVRASL